jgi:hypothetical protein
MSPRLRWFIKSAQGQLTLLGLTFVGAIGLAVVTVALRSVLFEPYIREAYPPLDKSARQLAEQIADGLAGPKEWEALVADWTEQMTVQELEKMIGPERADAPGLWDRLLEKNRKKAAAQAVSTFYGYWMLHPDEDPNDRLLVCLLQSRQDETLTCLKKTLTVGDLAQRQRALHGATVAAQQTPAEAVPLLRFAHDRALRRGEMALAEQAQAALSQVGKGKE